MFFPSTPIANFRISVSEIRGAIPEALEAPSPLRMGSDLSATQDVQGYVLNRRTPQAYRSPALSIYAALAQPVA